jgi:pimeloyl-[acyl-carrier protein] methyl ester esterase
MSAAEAASLARCAPQHALPLALLHGWAMNLRVFDGLLDTLQHTAAADSSAARFAITRYDLPGHGRAAEPAELYRDSADGGWEIGKVAQHLLAQLPPRSLLLGWSLGGKIAMEIAAQAPDRLLGLVLVSATPRFAATEDWPHGASAETLEQLARHLRERYAQTLGEFLSLQVRGSAQASATLQRLQQALLERGECPPEVLLRSLRLLHGTDQRQRLKDIRVPTLVIAGQYDRVVHPLAARALAERIAGAEFVEIARCGHAPFISNETEFVTALMSFIERRLA